MLDFTQLVEVYKVDRLFYYELNNNVVFNRLAPTFLIWSSANYTSFSKIIEKNLEELEQPEITEELFRMLEMKQRHKYKALQFKKFKEIKDKLAHVKHSLTEMTEFKALQLKEKMADSMKKMRD